MKSSESEFTPPRGCGRCRFSPTTEQSCGGGGGPDWWLSEAEGQMEDWDHERAESDQWFWMMAGFGGDWERNWLVSGDLCSRWSRLLTPTSATGQPPELLSEGWGLTQESTVQ